MINKIHIVPLPPHTCDSPLDLWHWTIPRVAAPQRNVGTRDCWAESIYIFLEGSDFNINSTEISLTSNWLELHDIPQKDDSNIPKWLGSIPCSDVGFDLSQFQVKLVKVIRRYLNEGIKSQPYVVIQQIHTMEISSMIKNFSSLYLSLFQSL